MTDRELIRAYRHCYGAGMSHSCIKCPIYEADECGAVTSKAVLSRMEALLAENEHLREVTKMPEYTTLQKCWYRYYTGEKFRRKHLEMKFVCTKCHCVWDRQGYAFSYCPGCGRRVAEIEEVRDDG